MYNQRVRSWRWIAPSPLVLALGVATAAYGQNFGLADRAQAARQMIILGVEQGVASLPPTSGQSYAYQYNAKRDAFERSKVLGPTSFRAPQTIGQGNFDLRLATSYFELSHHFGPIDYRVDGNATRPYNAAITRFGLDADAKVGVTDIALAYGVLSNVDLTLNIPIVVVDASAREVFVGKKDDPTGTRYSAPSGEEADQFLLNPERCAAGRNKGSCLLDEFLGDQSYQLRHVPYPHANFSGEGTNVGLGRISVGARMSLPALAGVRLAFAPELYFPSPNQDELAGSNTFAIEPRMLAAYPLTDWARLHLDAAYSYDFDREELRHFKWDTGFSFPLKLAGDGAVTFDLGVGGAAYDKGIKWTPTTASFVDLANNPNNTITALQNNRLGTTFVDALAGVRVRISETIAVTGNVVVPVNNEGFRPSALGSFGVEVRS